MTEPRGAQSFRSAEAYDAFMGRYSRALAPAFLEAAAIAPGDRVLDVGCGPGALTTRLVVLVGPDRVAACDPSPPFVEACRSRHPGVDVRQGDAEHIPFPDGSFDAALSQLVLHFVPDPEAAAREFCRVVRPGGRVAACVWDQTGGMELLGAFADAARRVDPHAPTEYLERPFGRSGELRAWLERAECTDVSEQPVTVASTYAGFDELWSGFEGGVGPAGAYTTGLTAHHRAALRTALHERLGSPAGAFTLRAQARVGVGTVASG